MLSIEKEEEIRRLINENPDASNRGIGRLSEVSRVAVRRVRDTQNTIDGMGMKKAAEVRKMVLCGLSRESISIRARVSREQIKAVVYFFFLQPRDAGSLVSRCPTCSSMMFSNDSKEAKTPRRADTNSQPPNLNKRQAEALYRIVSDLCDLEQCCIITSPLFYYLAQRAKQTLGGIHGSEENKGCPE